MSNSPLVTYTRLTAHCSRRTHPIDTITIHCYVGQVTAKQGCDMFATTSRQASANYVVGRDGSIGLCVEEKNRAWTTDSRDNDNRAVTIETASGTRYPYEVTPEAYEALINLVADICRRNGIRELRWKADRSLIGHPDQQNMTVHRWFANKECPGEWLYSRHGEIARRVNAMLGEMPEPPDTTVYEVSLGKVTGRPAAEAAVKKAKAAGFPDAHILGLPEPVPQPPAGSRSYTVRRGDTLYLIALRQLHRGSRWKEIQQLNHLQSTTINPGQELILPGT